MQEAQKAEEPGRAGFPGLSGAARTAKKAAKRDFPGLRVGNPLESIRFKRNPNGTR